LIVVCGAVDYFLGQETYYSFVFVENQLFYGANSNTNFENQRLVLIKELEAVQVRLEEDLNPPDFSACEI